MEWNEFRAKRKHFTGSVNAKVLSQGLVTRNILFIGGPTGTATAAKDMIVHKFGRTTSYRAGASPGFFLTCLYPMRSGK